MRISKRKFTYYTGILLVVLLVISGVACKKSFENRSKLAGVYKVQKLERIYYKNNQPDSTVSLENLGTICLYDNANEDINEVYAKLTLTPLCWTQRGIGLGSDVFWYTNLHGKPTTVSFFSVGLSIVFTTFTIEDFSRTKEMRWYFVEQNAAGGIKYVESLYVKKDR